MIDYKEFFDYYLSDDFLNNLVLPERTSFRHFRGRTVKGGWRKIPFKISTKEELQKWIIKLGLIDVYYSSSTWLNPHKVSAKGSGDYLCADNLILSNDLVFDIDCEQPISIKGLNNSLIACREIHNSINRMRKKGRNIVFKYFSFTGNKGFRLVYDDDYVMPANHRERLDKTEENRKVFIVNLLEDIKDNTSEKVFNITRSVIDKNITINPLGVIRVVGSVHGRTKFLSVKLPLKLLHKNVKSFINNIPHIGKIKPGILSDKEMTLENENKHVVLSRPRSNKLVGDETGLSSLPRNYFLTNKVLGVRKCFIPVLIYNKDDYKKEVSYLQKKYVLGDLLLFEEDNKIFVLSMKLFQKRALQKMLNESSSKTKYDFLRRSRIIFPMSMSFLKVIKGSRIKGVSRGHSLMFNQSYDVMSGWDKVEMVIGEKNYE